MSEASHLLFIQKRSLRAGAQTSLARMVGSTPLRDLNPAVLVGTEGWLHQDLKDRAFPVALTEFPSPRAIMTRLLGYGAFARRASAKLAEVGIRPGAIIANDHQECPLALALSARLGGVPVLGILRTPGMDRRDFKKYACENCDGLMGEGVELNERVQTWTDKQTALFEEGFCEEEFFPPVPFPSVFPSRILVVGSESPRKGFGDFIEALDLIESREPAFPGLRCDFTGTIPVGLESLVARPRRSQFIFLGRVEGFAKLVRNYPLAIHPSRAETFGMAPIEAMLAGVPTMVSATGIAATLPLPTTWIFEPASPKKIAERLTELWRRWVDHALDVAAVQQHIRACYHIDHTAGFVRESLVRIGAARPLK